MKKYVLYGVGINCERFLYHHISLKDRIAFCIDAHCTGKFHDIPIVKLETIKDLSNYTIIVTTTESTYFQIKAILEERGLVEFQDFLWGQVIGKKLVIFNTNCYKQAIIKYLLKSKKFKDNYTIYPTPLIHLNKEGSINSTLLKKADVYIHQDIRSNNSFGYKLSDEYILPKLGKACVSITIPNLVGMAGWMFPMQEDSNKKFNKRENGMTYGAEQFYKDNILEEAYSQKLNTLDDYTAFWTDYQFDSDFLEELFRTNMKKLCDREKNWDIKIADFIKENYKKIPIYIDQNHPSKYVMTEICRQLVKLLGIDDITDDSDYESSLSFVPSGILPSVRKYFHFEFQELYENIFPENLYDQLTFDLKEYIRWYMWWHHELYLL